jgi:hypothetical protein
MDAFSSVFNDLPIHADLSFERRMVKDHLREMAKAVLAETFDFEHAPELVEKVSAALAELIDKQKHCSCCVKYRARFPLSVEIARMVA